SPKQIGAGRAMTRRSGPLLPIHLLTGAIDLAAVLHVMGAALTARELPAYAAVEDVGARGETENAVRQIDRARRRAVQCRNVQLHLSRLPSLPERRLQQAQAARRLLPLRSPAGGTFPAWADPPAASFSQRPAV